jgi:hypothetical protein
MVVIMAKSFDCGRLRGEFVVRCSEFGVIFLTVNSTNIAKLSGDGEGVFRSFTDSFCILDRIDRMNGI